MKKRRGLSSKQRAEQAIARALRTILEQGWTVAPHNGTRFVARKRIHEREDESTTSLYESDFTLEGLAANVTRREREEGRKS